MRKEKDVPDTEVLTENDFQVIPEQSKSSDKLNKPEKKYKTKSSEDSFKVNTLSIILLSVIVVLIAIIIIMTIL